MVDEDHPGVSGYGLTWTTVTNAGNALTFAAPSASQDYFGFYQSASGTAASSISVNYTDLSVTIPGLTWNSPSGGTWNTNAGNQPWLSAGSAAAFTTGAGVVFSMAGTGTINAGGNLAFNRGDTSPGYTFSSQIVGGGGVTQMGPGILNLTSGMNYYSGGTTVLGGTLNFTVGSLGEGLVNGGPAPVVVTPNNGTATLVWAGAGNTTNISANGLTLGPGTTVFNLNQNAVVFSGGTISSSGNLDICGSGTLQIGYGSVNLGSGSVTVETGSGLAFNRYDTFTVANAIGGGGSLTQTGNGTLILTGSNTYTGGTTVYGGPLQIGNGGSSGSITGNVYLPYYFSNLAYDRAGTVTAPGNISGYGGLAQEGSGTLILSGTNTYSGGTSVENGLLVATNPKAISGGSLLEIGSSASVVLGQQGSQYIEGLGRIAGAPLGSQATGTSGGGVMAPAASGSAGAGGINAVPEPGTLALLAAAAACGVAAAWRRRRG
ncbi:MAG: autotransporter-associated beta strand repeat-containing protein [Thermoguttaceae bacterium]